MDCDLMITVKSSMAIAAWITTSTGKMKMSGATVVLPGARNPIPNLYLVDHGPDIVRQSTKPPTPRYGGKLPALEARHLN